MIKQDDGPSCVSERERLCALAKFRVKPILAISKGLGLSLYLLPEKVRVKPILAARKG
jgi:hypothetical protein